MFCVTQPFCGVTTRGSLNDGGASHDLSQLNLSFSCRNKIHECLQQQNLFSHRSGGWSPRSGCRPIQCLAYRWPPCPHRAGRVSSLESLLRTLIRWDQAPPSWAHLTLVTSLLQRATVGWGVRHRIGGGAQTLPCPVLLVRRPPWSSSPCLEAPCTITPGGLCTPASLWEGLVPWLPFIPLGCWNLQPLDWRPRESWSVQQGSVQSAGMAAPWGPGLLSVSFMNESSAPRTFLAHRRHSVTICGMNGGHIAAV